MPDEKPAPPPFEPLVPAERELREFTLRAVLTGTLLGVIFGASSLYLVLKVGLTVSASIPVAVISLALFRGLSKLGLRDSTVLEHNIAQTAGSAGESIAFGVGVTMPAVLILGFDLELPRVMLVAVLGGLLGILMMIPLRRSLIVQEHGTLKYPEGTACAAVLTAAAAVERQASAAKAWEAGGAAGDGANGGGATSGEVMAGDVIAGEGDLHGAVVFKGFGLGLVYKTLMVALRAWKDTPEKVFGAPFRAGSIGIEISPELLGVGYIIGPRIAATMCAGGVLAYLVLIPMIEFFGAGLAHPLAPGTVPIAEMGPNQIRGAYVLYIGAGAVATGGIISVFRSLPTIWHSLRAGLAGMRRTARGSNAAHGEAADVPRTERDLSLKFVAIGVVGLLAGIVAAPSLHMNLLGAILIVVFGFVFVTVSSRLTGEIGSSSNPISGMTVATLLLTCLVFLAIGWTGGTYYVTALSVGAVVCIAASNGGTTSQDLKTGYLLGGTPKLQQYAILIGALVSALLLGPILLRLNDAATVYVPADEVAPGLRVELHAPKSSESSASREAPEAPGERLKREALVGPQSRGDGASYYVWHKADDVGGPAGKYLVRADGTPVWFVDPGINGTHTARPDGSTVRKFDAPKATLMSYIIKGILGRQLPWALVLLGGFIAIALELAGVPSLAFAVGVYLPLSASSPVLVGGVVRYLVDRRRRSATRGLAMNEAEFSAASDRSPSVLLASGYIGGGAIAGILIAFMAGVFDRFDASVVAWASRHNPLYAGPWADGLSLLPFVLLVGLLFGVGWDRSHTHPRTVASR